MCEVRQTMAKMCKNMFQIRNCRCHHRHPYCINSSRVLFAQVRAEQFRLHESYYLLRFFLPMCPICCRFTWMQQNWQVCLILHGCDNITTKANRYFYSFHKQWHLWKRWKYIRCSDCCDVMQWHHNGTKYGHWRRFSHEYLAARSKQIRYIECKRGSSTGRHQGYVQNTGRVSGEVSELVG